MSAEKLPPLRLEELWPAVCARARRPVAGVRLAPAAAGEVAAAALEEFMDTFPRRPEAPEAVLHWLAARVAPAALERVAAGRRQTGNHELDRDPLRLEWAKNPDFDDLKRRGPDGALISRGWAAAEPVLWHRARPVLIRTGVAEDDARDVFMETLTELLRARPAEPGPLEKMRVFEELPRFFAMMTERRAISWLRKQSAQKRQPVHPLFTVRLDDPDNALARSLADPRGTGGVETAGFDRIREACGPALTPFEWHLLEALFVEASHTRLELAEDEWVLERLGVTRQASESKRRRRLNLFLGEALAKLGRKLESCDL